MRFFFNEKDKFFMPYKNLRNKQIFTTIGHQKRINRGKIEIGEKYRMKRCEEAGSFFEALLE